VNVNANSGPQLDTAVSYNVPSRGGKNLAMSIKINGAVDISEHPKKNTDDVVM
jgi:hypothetical protein